MTTECRKFLFSKLFKQGENVIHRIHTLHLHAFSGFQQHAWFELICYTVSLHIKFHTSSFFSHFVVKQFTWLLLLITSRRKWWAIRSVWFMLVPPACFHGAIHLGGVGEGRSLSINHVTLLTLMFDLCELFN